MSFTTEKLFGIASMNEEEPDTLEWQRKEEMLMGNSILAYAMLLVRA